MDFSKIYTFITCPLYSSVAIKIIAGLVYVQVQFFAKKKKKENKFCHLALEMRRENSADSAERPTIPLMILVRAGSERGFLFCFGGEFSRELTWKTKAEKSV